MIWFILSLHAPSGIHFYSSSWKSVTEFFLDYLGNYYNNILSSKSVSSVNKIAINRSPTKHHSILLSPSVRSTPSTTRNRCNEKSNPATCLPALSCHPDRWIHFHGHGGMAMQCFRQTAPLRESHILLYKSQWYSEW